VRNKTIGILVLMMFLIVGCSRQPAGDSQSGAAVEDYASLIAALESAGATVESGDPVLPAKTRVLRQSSNEESSFRR
jgi:uncharacterized protein YcfL